VKPEIIFDVDPIGKPRMTQRDKWMKRPAVIRYHAYRDTVRWIAKDWAPPERDYWLLFTIAMPSSWSERKRAAHLGQPHQQTPDKDNLEKAFLDCFGEDCHIWDGRVSKIWGLRGSIHVYQCKEFAEIML